MIGNFDACIAFTLGEEGGFSDDPDDPGGATNMGITLAELSLWRGIPCTADDVRNLQRPEAIAIYLSRYWRAMSGDALPLGVDLAVVDFGINAGPGRAARVLQAACGATVDGDIGPLTIAAAQRFNSHPQDLLIAIAGAEENYYHSLQGYVEFGAGWSARTRRREALALKMAGVSVAT